MRGNARDCSGTSRRHTPIPISQRLRRHGSRYLQALQNGQREAVSDCLTDSAFNNIAGIIENQPSAFLRQIGSGYEPLKRQSGSEDFVRYTVVRNGQAGRIELSRIGGEWKIAANPSAASHTAHHRAATEESCQYPRGYRAGRDRRAVSMSFAIPAPRYAEWRVIVSTSPNVRNTGTRGVTLWAASPPRWQDRCCEIDVFHGRGAMAGQCLNSRVLAGCAILAWVLACLDRMRERHL